MQVIRVRYGTDIPMALSNAERQKRHRERQKQKLAAAAPGLAAQYENVGADLREKLYSLINAENMRRDRLRRTAGIAPEPTDFSRVILDIALDEDHSGLAGKAGMVFVQGDIENDPAEIGWLRRNSSGAAEPVAAHVLGIDQAVELFAQVRADVLVLSCQARCSRGELLLLPLPVPFLSLCVG